VGYKKKEMTLRNQRFTLENFLEILKKEFTQRYSALLSETSFDKLVQQIRAGTYKLDELKMCDILMKQLHEVDGYIKRDELITIHSQNNEMYHHFFISLSLEDRIVVDALTQILYLSNKSYFQEKKIYMDLSGIRDDYRKEMHSWENVHSVAVFNVKPLLLKLDRDVLWGNLKKSISVDSGVFNLYSIYMDIFPKHKANLAQYESYIEDCADGAIPFKGVPLIGSLPMVLLTLFSSLDRCVDKFIGDWPYLRINYDLVLPIFGESPADEEPYCALYDHFIHRKVPVHWCWLYEHSGVKAISSGYIHLDNGKVFFTWGDGP